MNAHKALEESLLEVFNRVRMEESDSLESRGFRIDEPRVRVGNSDDNTYTSEIYAWIRNVKNDQIEGGLEFWVFKSGFPDTCEIELENWLREEIRRTPKSE